MRADAGRSAEVCGSLRNIGKNRFQRKNKTLRCASRFCGPCTASVQPLPDSCPLPFCYALCPCRTRFRMHFSMQLSVLARSFAEQIQTNEGFCEAGTEGQPHAVWRQITISRRTESPAICAPAEFPDGQAAHRCCNPPADSPHTDADGNRGRQIIRGGPDA